MNDHDPDQELEQELRAGLHRHADDVVVSSAVLGQVRAETGRRRRTRWMALGAAAAAVVGIGTLGVVVVGNGGDEPAPALDLPTEWRAESWAGLTVDVPADWGYDGAPNEDGLVCADRRAAAGRPGGASGWVGRPILASDVCVDVGRHGFEPTEPHVWLGAGVEPGTVEYDNGYVQETVEVEGTTLTVATDDAALRQEILDSARAQDLCRASFDSVIPGGEAAMTAEGRGELKSAHVCVYRSIDGAFALTYAATVSPEQAAAAYLAQEGAAVVTREDVCMGDLHEFVLLDATYDDLFGSAQLERRAVYEMGCGGEVNLGDRRTHMVARGVEPWAVGGIPGIVTGPTANNAMSRYFIGIQG